MSNLQPQPQPVTVVAAAPQPQMVVQQVRSSGSLSGFKGSSSCILVMLQHQRDAVAQLSISLRVTASSE
jgi:hypothetical protein